MNYLKDVILHLGKRLPSVLQVEAAECGMVCLAMIIEYHGNICSLVDLRRRSNVSLKGVTLKHVIQMAEKLGLGSRAIRVELTELNKLTLPCILHWDFNHFVVLKNVSRKRLVIHDPAHGVRELSFSDASRSFTGVALELWPEAGFQKQEAKPQVRILSLMGRITGLHSALSQILLLAFTLEILSLISPFFLQWTIDYVIVSEDHDLLKTLVVGFGLLMIFQQAVIATRSWVMMHFSTVISVQWKANVFGHLLKLPIQYFEKRNLGDVVSRFSSTDSIQRTLTGVFFSGILDGIMSIATLVLMFVYSPTLAFISLAAILFYILGRWAWYRPLRNATEEQIIHAARQETFFLETVRGIRPLKLFQRQDERRATWLALLVKQINAGIRTQKLQLLYSQINGLLFGLETIITIWLGAKMIMSGNFTVGILMAYTAYKTQFIGRATSLVDNILELSMLRLHGERLSDIVLSPIESRRCDVDLKVLAERPADIEIKGLSFRYSDMEPYLLKNISMTFREGEFVALTGVSGSGKSTLLNLLIGILNLTSGTIFIAGFELQKFGCDAFRPMIGTVMQDDTLFAGSLADNISFFDTQLDNEWIIECAKMAAVHEEIEAMPMAYNTLVGDMGTVLSGGQKQRVLLARALYKKPRILLLDEATSHLDVSCEYKVNCAVKNLKMTRIIVAHRPETIDSADRVVVLGAGKIISDNRRTL